MCLYIYAVHIDVCDIYICITEQDSLTYHFSSFLDLFETLSLSQFTNSHIPNTIDVNILSQNSKKSKNNVVKMKGNPFYETFKKCIFVFITVFETVGHTTIVTDTEK